MATFPVSTPLAEGERDLEIEIVLLCSRLQLTAEEGQRLSALLAIPPDWRRLQRAAYKHDVHTFLYWHLKQLDAAALVPAPLWDWLVKQHEARTLLNGKIATHYLREILQQFDAAGIDVIVLKGLAIIESAYPDVGLRSMGDHDLLVREEQLEAAWGILLGMGYRPVAKYAALKRAKHLPQLLMRGSPHPVELHWRLVRPSEFAVDMAAIWQRARPATIAGWPALSLAPEDMLLHVAIHLANDHLFRIGLAKLMDIAALANRDTGDFDWDILLARAGEWGARRATWLALAAARDVLAADVPAAVLDTLCEPGSERWLDSARRMLLDPPSRPQVLSPRFWAVLTARTLGERVSALRQVFSRTEDGWTDTEGLGEAPATGLYATRLHRLTRTYAPAFVRLLTHPRESQEDRARVEARQALRQWLVS